MTNAITAAPCAKCPFRKDVPIYLRRERREEIAHALNNGGDFSCHATVNYVEDDDGESYGDTSEATTCAGAAKALMLAGGTTQLMRVAERLGLADLDRTAERGAEVWSLTEWPLLAEGATGDNPEYDEDAEVETCGTVNAGCLAPAGYLGAGGGVLYGTEAADEECVECGEAVCSNCISEQGHCGFCAEYEDEDY